MKTKVRILFILIAMSLLFGFIVGQQAYATDIAWDEAYLINEDGRILGFSEYGENLLANGTTAITVPATVNSITVKGIEDYAFANSAITSISLTEGIEKIGVHAFDSCTNLTTFTAPTSLREIGTYAFQNCTALTNFSLVRSDPNTKMTTIKEGTFKGCTALVGVTLPESISHILDSAFYGCTSLEVIELPDKVRTIEANAFRECSSLETVYVDKDESLLNTVGKHAFYGCDSLVSLNLGKELKNFHEYALTGASSLTDIYINKGKYNNTQKDLLRTLTVDNISWGTDATIHTTNTLSVSTNPIKLVLDKNTNEQAYLIDYDYDGDASDISATVTSTKPNIVSLNISTEGILVTGLNEGTATIDVTNRTSHATIAVTVSSDLTLGDELYPQNVITLKPTFDSDKNAVADSTQIKLNYTGNLTVSAPESDIATVDLNGNILTITSGTGIGILPIEISDNNHTTTLYVNVQHKLRFTSSNTWNMTVGGTNHLYLYYTGDVNNLVLASSNSSIVPAAFRTEARKQVTVDALAVGNATIFVTDYKGASVTRVVSVSEEE